MYHYNIHIQPLIYFYHVHQCSSSQYNTNTDLNLNRNLIFKHMITIIVCITSTLSSAYALHSLRHRYASSHHRRTAPTYNCAHLRSIPAVLLDHVRQLNYVFAFFVFLAALVSVLVLPAEWRFAAIAKYIGHGVQSREQHTLLRLAAAHIHHRVEEVGRSLTALERFRDKLIV